MKKYAKIENEETKVCSVGLGNNVDFYISIGMQLLDVEQAYNGSWYLSGYAPKPTPEEILAEKKSEREQLVESIVVNVDGINFDGDETSQARMARTITGAQALGLPTSKEIQWMSADNTAETVTLEQLARALAAAGEKQTELWFEPYASK